MAAEAPFHDTPDRPEHRRYDIDLVSPEVACGAGWLANCLIELGIPAWKPWGADDREHWQVLGGGRYRYVGGDNGWSRVLPALTSGREFEFRPDRCLRVHHAWPTAHPAADSTVLFVRDPRDALLSTWRRCRSLGSIPDDIGFVDFCHTRFFHFPLAWKDYLLVFLRVWRTALDRRGGHVVRFEDYRRDAMTTLSGVLDVLDIDATAAQLRSTVVASSVARVQAEDARLRDAGIVPTAIVRGLPPGEWTTCFDAATSSAVAMRYGDVMAWLGYSPATAIQAPAPMQSRDRVHAAIVEAVRQTGTRVDEDGWLWCTLRDASTDVDLLVDAK